MIRWTKAAVLSLAVGFGATHCTKDDAKVNETVKQEGTETDASGKPLTSNQNFAPKVVHFKFDSSALQMPDQESLAELADFLQKNTTSLVEVAGHCDEKGTPDYNLVLGQKRAEAVKSFLVQKGIQADRVKTVSYGEEKPVSTEHNEMAWAQNRRAEFSMQ